jgi:hypothetical protein
MESEGQGKRPPAPVLVEITLAEIEMCIDFARKYVRQYAYAGKPGWKGGLVKSLRLRDGRVLEQDIAGTVVGKAGEAALCKIAGQSIDIALRTGGDGGRDLPLPCGHVQVKTFQKDYASRILRIPAENVPWFAFAKWDGREECVSLEGYLSHAAICRSPHVPSPRGNWMNYQIDKSRLHPIRSLLRIRPISEVM